MPRSTTSTCIIALFALAAVAGAQGPIESPVNGHYYEIVISATGAVDWAEARDAAAGMTFNGMPGHLATFTSAAEEDWVIANFGAIGTDDHIWIGATDEATEGTWVWITGEPWSHTNWAMGEPNGGSEENCLEYTDGEAAWNDESCISSRRMFLVEYGVDPVPTLPFWALAGLMAVLALAGTLVFRRRLSS